jgi:hypothetical protein
MIRITTPFRWLAALALWLGPLLAAHATHILGGEITYSSVVSTTAGVPRYHITSTLYRDPTGVPQPTIQLACSRNGCGNTITTGNFVLTVPASRVATTYSLGCPTYAGYYYEVILFEVDVDLPTGQWTLSVAESNRSAGIRNLPYSVNTGYYVSTYLDNSLARQNEAPRFLSTLLPFLCNGQAQRYSFSAFDSDGDSLVYQFRQPEQSIVPPLIAPYACGSAIDGTLSPHFQINASTGALTALPVPVQQGLYAMAARVSEYRLLNGSWQLIGYVTRDITYLSVASVNQTPRFTGLRLNNTTSVQPLDKPVRVQPGQKVMLALDATDPDANQTLRFQSQAPAIIPGFILQTTSARSALLTWQVPATIRPGRYTATIAVLDNGCPNASEDYTISFLVAAQPLAARSSTSLQATAYPTPFREQVQFQVTGGGQAITVIDALGHEVARLTSAANGLVRWQPAPTLPAGLYIARSATNGQPLARMLRAE